MGEDSVIVKLPELHECFIVKRLNLFTVLVDLNGYRVKAYVNNTGRLRDYLVYGKKCYCMKTVRGRLGYRVIGVEEYNVAALIDTMYQEMAFIKLYEEHCISWLYGYKLFKRNYKLGSELIDYAFKHKNEVLLVELKSAVMRLPGDYAGYPDAPTTRGKKQIKALADYARKGGKSIVLFIVGIPKARGFRLYCCADEEIEYIVNYATRNGVEFKAINIYLDPSSNSIILRNINLPVILKCDSTICN